MGRLAGRAFSARSFPSVFSSRLRIGAVATMAAAAFCTGAAAQEPKGSPDHIKAATSAIDGNAIRANAATSKDWPAFGLDYAETRFSKLDQINAEQRRRISAWCGPTISNPRAASRRRRWSSTASCTSRRRGASCTPSTRAPASGSGPSIPRCRARPATRAAATSSTAASRSIKGKVFVGAYDGRLIALDAATGQKVWEKDTIIDRTRSYTITGAPRVCQGQGDHRQRRRRVRRARLRHRLRRRDRRADSGAGSPCPAIRAKPFEDESMAQRRQDLGSERQVLGDRRRRHGVGHA